MQAIEEHPEKSWFFEALGEVGQFAARLLKNFFIVLTIGAAFAVLITIAAYFGIAGGPVWRTSVLCSTVAVGSGILTLAMAGNLAVVFSLAQTVRAKQLAKRVLDALFAELLGVTDQNPHGVYEPTQKLHGMPIEQFRAKLKQAGRKILAHPIATSLPGFVRWLVRKAERLLVWATVRVVGAYASANVSEDRNVDLLALRTNLTFLVDDLVTRRITQGAIRLAFLVALVVAAAAWGLLQALARVGPA